MSRQNEFENRSESQGLQRFEKSFNFQASLNDFFTNEARENKWKSELLTIFLRYSC